MFCSKGMVYMRKIKLEETNYNGYKVVCRDFDFEVYNELDAIEFGKIKEVLGTGRRPNKRQKIYQKLDYISNQKFIKRCTIEWLQVELEEKRFNKLETQTQNKLKIMFEKVKRAKEGELEVEEEFAKTVILIGKYSIYTRKQVTKALFQLYDELNMEYPYNDWKHSYLTLNSGRNVKEVLNYVDGNKCIGIVIKSLRMIEDKELEKEMGWGYEI